MGRWAWATETIKLIKNTTVKLTIIFRDMIALQKMLLNSENLIVPG
ncbi:MAG: hypothetical protein M5U34_38140 [Chloroflexi bacterium]|nr:hypothetical protein [Chloroflexota bacterium]